MVQRNNGILTTYDNEKKQPKLCIIKCTGIILFIAKTFSKALTGMTGSTLIESFVGVMVLNKKTSSVKN